MVRPKNIYGKPEKTSPEVSMAAKIFHVPQIGQNKFKTIILLPGISGTDKMYMYNGLCTAPGYCHSSQVINFNGECSGTIVFSKAEESYLYLTMVNLSGLC